MISTANKFLGLSILRRRTRRCIVVAYWILVAFFSWSFLLHQAHHSRFDVFGILIGLQILINLPGLLGGVGGGIGGAVKPFSGVRYVPVLEDSGIRTLFSSAGPPAPNDNSALDERETRLRDRIHFLAYTRARWFALLLFAVYGLLGYLHPEWLLRMGPFFFFLLTLTLWSLPQTLILWTEPDMEQPQ